MRYTLLIILIAISACKVDEYLTYKEDLNTIEQYNLLNDSTLLVKKKSTDPKYGRTVEKPIFVGTTHPRIGGENRKYFLHALTAKDGEELIFERLKSCCPFRTKNSRTIGPDQKFGLLDIWIVKKKNDATWADTLYINAYDEGELIAPTGYKIKTK